MDIFVGTQPRSDLLPDPVKRVESCGRCGLPIHGPSCLAEIVLRLGGVRHFDKEGNPLHPPDTRGAALVTAVKPVHQQCSQVLGVRPVLNGYDHLKSTSKNCSHAS